MLGIADLADNPETVFLVAGDYLGVDGQGGFELGELEGLLEAEELNAVTENVQGAALIDLCPEASEKDISNLRTMVFQEDLQAFGWAV